MANLTIEQGLITLESADLTPVPGHSLVVYQKLSDTGRKHYATLSPGELFRPKFLDRRFDFVRVAVRHDSNQRFSFSWRTKSLDRLHHFTLHATLSFGVSNPALLVDAQKSDPLMRVQEESTQILGSAVAGQPWVEVRSEGFNPNVVLAMTYAGPGGVQSTNLEYLQRFAATIGMDLREIQLGRSILKEDLKVERKVGESIEDRMIRDLEHRKSLEEKRREQEMAKLDQQQKLELDEGIYQQERLTEFQRGQRVREAFVDYTIKAVGDATENISSPQDLEKAARHFKNIFAELGGSAFGPAADGNTALGSGPGVSGLLPETIEGFKGGLGSLLSEIFEKVEALRCSEVEKRRLLSPILHLAAEGLRGEKAQIELVEEYQGRIGRLLKSLRGRMDVEQFRFLKTLSESSNILDFFS